MTGPSPGTVTRLASQLRRPTPTSSLAHPEEGGAKSHELLLPPNQANHIFFFFFPRWRFTRLTLYFTVVHNDPAVPQDHTLVL